MSVPFTGNLNPKIRGLGYLRLLQSLLIRFLLGQQGRLSITISNEPFDPPVVGAINITATERI